MKIIVQRFKETDKSVISRLIVDGQFEVYGLEPSRKTPFHPGHPCIPAGTYRVILTPSPHLGYVTPELLAVPGRTAIRWHVGNYPKDVLGCVAVGQTYSLDCVNESKLAFEKLMTLLRVAVDMGEDITAEYEDPS